jgi:DNA-binding transcriptional ArsR family regulator
MADRTSEAAAARALAHPLRLELLDLLRFGGPSTATLLARRTGESSGSTSYHLRELARYGFIEEAPGQDGRERRWRYRHRSVTLEGDEESGHQLLVELLSREAHALDRYLARREQLPDWDASAFFKRAALRLTAVELAELNDELEALLSRFRRAIEDDPPDDAKPVRVLAFGYPVPMEDT